jgi:hypothetical protein
MLKFGLSFPPQRCTASLARRIKFEISDFCRCILLVLSVLPSALSFATFLDQWVAEHGWRMDYVSRRNICMVWSMFSEAPRLISI